MSSERRPSIEPKPDGPYLVKNVGHLASRKGDLEARGTMALCRCGKSANKPFCDGTHAEVGFSSDKLEGRVADAQESYEGDGITIRDNRGICAHAGKCTDGLPAVFRLKQEPWIDPRGASAEEIAATIRTCPSGALRYSTVGESDEDEPAPVRVFIAPNGPYVVTGGPELIDTPLGEGASTQRFTLCRCGGSKNKPFCDGSHWYNDFRDDDN